MLVIHPAILGGLVICSLLLVWTLWEKETTRFIIRGVTGIVTLWLGNFVLPTTLVLEWQIVHIGIAVIFGVPGVIIMFVLKYLGINLSF